MCTKLFLLGFSAWVCWAVQSPPAQNMFRSLPVTFERNQGQWPRSVELGAHIGGHLYTFAGKEIVIDGVVHLDLVSSGPGKLEALDPVETKTNYLGGSDSRKWVTGVPNYGRIRCRNAFPGIDLTLYGSHGELEFDYIVAPGAAPNQIQFRVRGARAKSVSGALKLTTPSGDVLEIRGPIAYQNTAAGRTAVECQFRLDPSGKVGFAIASFDRTTPLFIDPVLTFLGVLQETYASPLRSAAMDSGGALYLGGTLVNSTISTTPGVLRDTSTCGRPSLYSTDSWVIKLNPANLQVAWATYFPNVQSAAVRSIALDPAGNIVLGGDTGSAYFPVTPDAYLSTLPAGGGGFLAKLNSTGSAVLYSTFLENVPLLMKIDSRGDVYLSNGPTVQKFSPDRSAMVYTTPTPGGVTQITVDDSGNLYAISGPSPQLTVTPGAYKSSNNDGLYILRFDPQGNAVFAASFNALPDYTNAARPPDLTIDPAGNIVFTGLAGTGVPVVDDPDPQTNDCDPEKPCMAYVAALDPSGSSLLYSRLLGHGRGEKLAFGPDGDVYVVGEAWDLSFPRTFDAFQYCSNPPAPSAVPSDTVITTNGFIIRLDILGKREFSSFLGTSSTPEVDLLQLYGDRVLYVEGYNFSATTTATSGGGSGLFSAVIDTGQAPRIPHACLVNATQNVGDANVSYLYVAPGEMVTLFGEGLGPQAAAPAEWNSDRTLAKSLAGVQVLFDGVPAPMLYAQANQVNCIVPFGVAANRTTSVVVQYAGNQTDALVFHVAPNVVDPFTKDYFPGADVIAINEDGTPNSAEHPAVRGSISTFFATGLGQTNPPLQDGQIVAEAAPTTNAVGVSFFDSAGSSVVSGEVMYQGAAPGEIAGVYQVNVKIPTNASTGHTQVQFYAVAGSMNIATEGIWLK